MNDDSEETMRPWFGLHLPDYTFPGTPTTGLFDKVVEQARTAEEAGFSLVTVMDHLYQIQGIGPVTEPMLEGWSSRNIARMIVSASSRRSIRSRMGGKSKP